MPKYLIAGIDPGVTKAYALLSLKGELIALRSSRIGMRQMMKEILGHGIPIAVCNDVAPCPKFVQRMASKLGARLIVPEKSLEIRQKRKLIEKEFKGIKLRNSHEFDALASAIYAYKSFKPLFDRIEKEKLRKEEEVKKMLVLGEARDLKQALMLLHD